MIRKVLLTGASGFLGKRIGERLSCTTDIRLSILVRRDVSALNANCHYIKNIDSSSDFYESLAGQNVVIHSAGRAHMMRDNSGDPLFEFRRVNVDGTLNLARQAIAAGVKRFIFISSIKVNGEYTLGSNFFTEDNRADPGEPYGVSKAEAEQGLLHLATTSDMEIVIIRPPLIYGPGVKGNFLSMVNLIKKGIPLPLSTVNNMRSLVALDNIVDLIITCIDHPKAANQIFLVSDGGGVSTSLLIRKIANAFDIKARLFPVPASMVKIFAKLIGKGPAVDRLYGNLCINNDKACRLLGWKPVITMDEQLSKLASHDKGSVHIG